jgi:hypothetical protein
MDDVQKHNTGIDVPSSQSFRAHYIVINLTALLQLLIYVVPHDKRSNDYKF